MTGKFDNPTGQNRIVAEIRTDRVAAPGRPEDASRDDGGTGDGLVTDVLLPQANTKSGPWVALALAIYSVVIGACIAAAIWYVLFRWPTGFLDAAGHALPQNVEATERFLFITVLGAGLGTAVHNLLGLHVHFAVLGDFDARFAGSYVIAPLASMGLGLALFAILQGGLLALGNDIAKPDESLRALLFYLAIGILTGVAWDTIILRFDAIARQIFGGEGSSLIKTTLDALQKRDGKS